jgi:preprotein translocase subunit SecA
MCAELTEAGREALEHIAPDGVWRNRLHREETVCTALAALHLFERNRHYLVREGAIEIVDESTGRVAPGRVWSHGLHRLIELKEDCDGAGDTATLAQITYQRFFQRYLSLAGMSGTLAEARGELRSVYGLGVVKVPLHRPDRRRILPARLFPERESLWDAALAEALEASRAGRPVLIGTDSVAESEAMSRRLTAAAVPHAVLNARQDRNEAQIVAQAGEPGRITVATNMAGRGTDITLGAGVAEAGGLHVICCQHNASRRIDRQLLGRCARRGDPGSARMLLALDKPLTTAFAPRWLRRSSRGGLERPQWLVRLIARVPQLLEERRSRAQRRELLHQDVRAAAELSFARPME